MFLVAGHVRALLGAAPSAGTPLPPSPSPTSLSRPPLTLATCCEAATTSSKLFSRYEYEYVRSAAPGIGEFGGGGGGGDGGGDDDGDDNGIIDDLGHMLRQLLASGQDAPSRPPHATSRHLDHHT